MSLDQSKAFIGLGKTLFNSSVALISDNSADLEIELLLTERLLRQKASGAWPHRALENLRARHSLNSVSIAENRDVVHPRVIEEFLNKRYPFLEQLKLKGLEKFSSLLNPEVKWVSHHRCHAMAATLMSPFSKTMIVVMDGAGSDASDFHPQDPERNLRSNPMPANERLLEECTVYLMDQGKLQCVFKNWQFFKDGLKTPDQQFSEGLGSFYEKAAEYIFNDKRSAGKVMGLAAFGKPLEVKKRSAFLDTLDWNCSFQGKSKADWEKSGHFRLYADIAATVQTHFEESVLGLVKKLSTDFPGYRNLILTGGCALNCTTNMKIHNTKLFDQIYVPPFPGDESIGLGAASALYHEQNEKKWKVREWKYQHGYFGSPASVPQNDEILLRFSSFKVIKPESITDYTAQKIADGAVIGWFQGRSETGPRSLGNRSILARADKLGLKDYLNSTVKRREDFRPYGCSVVTEKASEYFKVPENFQNPFMSFAVETRDKYQDLLKEVTHFDGTSRMQTVSETQNPLFHQLIKAVGEKTGLYCVLNTSLNVMGEPIAETLDDAYNFLANTPADGMAIGPYYVSKV